MWIRMIPQCITLSFSNRSDVVSSDDKLCPPVVRRCKRRPADKAALRSSAFGKGGPRNTVPVNRVVPLDLIGLLGFTQIGFKLSSWVWEEPFLAPFPCQGRALSEKAAVFPVCTAHAQPVQNLVTLRPIPIRGWMTCQFPLPTASARAAFPLPVAPLHNTSQLEPFLVFDPSSFQNDSQAALSTHQWACFPWLYPLLIRGRVKNGDFLYHRYWETSSRPEIMAQAGNLPDTFGEGSAVQTVLYHLVHTSTLNTDLMFWGLVGPKPEPRWKWLQKNNGYALVPQLKI
ncbi:hypothetical protein B0H14DRAFT_2639435 [Mycena olivaceomarginata]|nr:hypothetical protein B0H14DRAFT_2642069 [Mycena olivaceomarginata]KAJ7734402.1 hypothetical protein B0H14DRAFT_2639435 [Mycena olivaceomarginata]